MPLSSNRPVSDHVVLMVPKDPFICQEELACLSDLQVLRDDGSALLLAAYADLDKTNATSATIGAASSSTSAPFMYYYAARPAADCAALLIRRSAGHFLAPKTMRAATNLQHWLHAGGSA
jgi:hypothetical protein